MAVSEASAGQNSYVLGSGDKLRISVYNEPSLTGEYSVTPSGTIAFPLLGNIPAAGGTIEALQEAIASRLSKGEYIQDPRVSAEVLNFRPFYILGEINKPGEYPFAAGLTLDQAVATAGGFTYRANTRVIMLRRAQDKSERSVDLRDGPVRVMPGDTIRVGQRYF